MLSTIIAIFVGIFCGIFTGLIPGIHINLVSLLIVSFSPFLLKYTDPFSLIIVIIAMGITHTFLDFIPSIFLGVPEAETALSILPGHKMVLKGYAFEAIKFTTVGSFLSVIVTLCLFPFLIWFIPKFSDTISPYIGLILLCIVIFMTLKENGRDKKFWAFFVVTISGIFGYIVLNFPNIRDPLFPMLSGLFGISMLIDSLKNNAKIPKQRVTENLEVPKSKMSLAVIASTFAGTLTGFFPGLGAAQASIIGSMVVGGIKKIGTIAYLSLQGGINTTNFIISLLTFYSIDKARNGAIIAVQEIVGDISTVDLLYIVCAIMISAGIAVFLTMFFAKKFSKMIEKVNYIYLSYSIICLILILCFVFSGFIGLFVLFIATMIGLIPIYIGIGKNHSMGCLLIPVILYFLVG